MGYFSPKILSLITTHQCTAACDHCCFACTPKITKRIPPERLREAIESAAGFGSFKLVAFTGGECFLLGDELVALVQLASDKGLMSRCISNAYWAPSEKSAYRRLNDLHKAGLDELNISTGDEHAEYVPIERVIIAADVASRLGIRTLIMVEMTETSAITHDDFLNSPIIGDRIRTGEILLRRNVWIKAGGQRNVHQSEQYNRFKRKYQGCDTLLNVVAVTPDQQLVACCGLHLETTPRVHIGNLSEGSLSEIVNSSSPDLLKMWIHVEGPEAIWDFVAQENPSIQKPVASFHPCEACRDLCNSDEAINTLNNSRDKFEERILSLYQTKKITEIIGDRVNMDDFIGV